MRNALIHEALADVTESRGVGRDFTSKFGFFPLSLAAVGQQIPGISRAHNARAGERQSNTGGVDRDPPATPLLGDIGRGARTAGGVEDKITGISGH